MYILIIALRGEQRALTAASRKPLKRFIKAGDVWRLYRVGDGWCDGSSDDVWRVIDSRPTTAMIVYD